MRGRSYPSDLTDEHWKRLEPVFNAPGKRGPSTYRISAGWWTRCSTSPTLGSKWRFFPESFGRVDARLVAVPPLVAQGHLGAGADGAARGRTRDGRSRGGDAVDVGHRHPPGPRGIQRRVRLPRPRRPLRPHKSAKRVDAVDVTGVPVGALVVPDSTH